jgi:hypothetical protein
LSTSPALWGREGRFRLFAEKPWPLSAIPCRPATICATTGIERVQDHPLLVSVLVCGRVIDLENRAKSALGSSVRFRLGAPLLFASLILQRLRPTFLSHHQYRSKRCDTYPFIVTVQSASDSWMAGSVSSDNLARTSAGRPGRPPGLPVLPGRNWPVGGRSDMPPVFSIIS